MSTDVPWFQSIQLFLNHFVMAELATRSKMVKKGDHFLKSLIWKSLLGEFFIRMLK